MAQLIAEGEVWGVKVSWRKGQDEEVWVDRKCVSVCAVLFENNTWTKC